MPAGPRTIHVVSTDESLIASIRSAAEHLAANEVAVDAFLNRLISWSNIADVCRAVLDEYDGSAPDTVDDVIAADATARRLASAVIKHRLAN